MYLRFFILLQFLLDNMPRQARRNIRGIRRHEYYREYYRDRQRQAQGEQFREGTRCALICPPNDFRPFSLGEMALLCRHCNARHFSHEMTDRDRTSFALCCYKGKVILPDLRVSPIFQELISNTTSADRELKKKSLNYLENI